VYLCERERLVEVDGHGDLGQLLPNTVLQNPPQIQLAVEAERDGVARRELAAAA
jgi:hypothetical protein